MTRRHVMVHLLMMVAVVLTNGCCRSKCLFNRGTGNIDQLDGKTLYSAVQAVISQSQLAFASNTTLDGGQTWSLVLTRKNDPKLVFICMQPKAQSGQPAIWMNSFKPNAAPVAPFMDPVIVFFAGHETDAVIQSLGRLEPIERLDEIGPWMDDFLHDFRQATQGVGRNASQGEK